MRSASRRAVGPLVGGQHSDSLRASLVAGASGTLVLSVGALAWNFLAIIVLTRVLTVRGYGAYVYALAWSTALTVPAALGIQHLLLREVAASNARRQFGLTHGVIRRSYQVGVLASVGVTVAGVGGLLFIGRGDPAVQRAYLLGLLVIPGLSLVRIGEAVMRGLRHVVLGRIAETTIQPLLLVVLLVLGRIAVGRHLSAGFAMALTAASAIVAAGVSVVLVRRIIPAEVRRSKPEYQMRRWWQSARLMWLLSSTGVIQAQIGLILVGALGEVGDSGVLNAAVRWAMFVSFIQAVVSFPLAPAAARMYASGDLVRLQKLVGNAVRVTTCAAIPVAALLALFDEQVLGVFGPSFSRGGTALSILLLGELANVASGPASVTLLMTNHERSVARASLVSVALNIALGVALIPRFGIEGAAVAGSASLGLLNLLGLWILWQRERIWTGVVGIRLVRRLSKAAPSSSGDARQEKEEERHGGD